MANDIEAPQGLALVTGANRGIGKETAAQLGAAGYHVLVGARDAVAGEQAAKELRDRGIAALPLTLSVNDAESVAAAAHAVRTRFGRLESLSVTRRCWRTCTGRSVGAAISHCRW
ncbi:SDR family NAD(P)-dependent oxidoreductase [Streptomyces sp. DSM 41524]|uniref:SDR family NAD(P)-dependent oxidoreductase n=1 Tax=Streptomyces asiaticus subsp. ignotus TaxID=3098222 RepID=A0ABU7Q703_9ACTN|nr:SDR family NAD(P)-dependent oxidoreductase [Streptomyces sp. DSM 41524]